LEPEGCGGTTKINERNGDVTPIIGAATASRDCQPRPKFAEKDKGSLEPGKFADLAVLSQDIFSVPPPELPKTESVLTMVGGKIVYDAKALSTP